MRRPVLIAAVVVMTALSSTDEAMARKGDSATAPNGERGTAIAEERTAGAEGAGKVSVHDISFIFASNTGEPPGTDIGSGGRE